mgnify:CR=1 FL=1
MKALIAAILGGLIILTAAPATPAVAKVCYRCRGDKPVKYVCAARDTFKARKNARKLGCNWSSYSSSCKCGAWVKHRKSSFVQYALTLFP